MSERVAAFSRLLDEEQRAAIGADVDALVSIQERKAELLDAIRAAGEMTRPEMTELSARARNNLAWMRRLVGLFRGALQEDDTTATYGANGRRSGSPAPR